MRYANSALAYQSDKCMYPAARDEPVPKGAWRRHHIWILLDRLRGLLCLCQFRPVVSWNLLLESFSMRRRDEFGRLLKTDRLCNTCRGISILR